MSRPASLVTSSFVLVLICASAALTQTVVYSNQASLGSTSISAFFTDTEWDDLQLTSGGLLSELSLVTRHSGGGPQFASGFFDLRVFDEAGNFPQGDPLGVIPFSGEFPSTPAGTFSDGVLIGLPDLEPLGITLPSSGRIGLGVRFNQSGWGLIPSGPAELGSSPGGNWLGDVQSERFEFGNGLPYRLTVVDPLPPGPGVGNYNVFETALATPDHPTNNGGISADDQFFTGIGFEVERTTHITQVGGYMSGTGTVFAAIVQTDSLFGLPDPLDLSGDDVLATTLLEMPSDFDRQDVVGDIDLTLEPGYYALLLGSGKFGAEGEAFIRDNHIPNGNWDPYSIRQSDGQRFFQAGSHRFFANAQSAPGTVQVRPTFDTAGEVLIDAFGDITSVRLIDGEEDIIVDANPVGEPNVHTALEFSLEDVPLDREILQVTLELSLNLLTTSGPLQFDMLGYAGDGAAQRTDILGPKTVVGQTNFDTGSVGDIATVDIDPAFVTGLLGQASHLGLSIAPGPSGNFRYYTLESGNFGEPPLLTITLGPAPEPLLPGDYSGNGVIDAADYTVWRDVLTAGTTDLLNDPTPGTVDESDFAYWRAHFGEALEMSSGSGFAVVPEPSSGALLLVASLALFPRQASRLLARQTSVGGTGILPVLHSNSHRATGDTPVPHNEL